MLELGLELGFEFGSGFYKELMDWFTWLSGFLDVSQFFAQIKSSHNLIVVISSSKVLTNSPIVAYLAYP